MIEIKFWQWALAGAIAGFLLWQAVERMPAGVPRAPSAASKDESWLSPIQLARILESPPQRKDPALRSVTVYPPDNDGQLVTGEFLPDQLPFGAPIYRRFTTNAPVPFKLAPIIPMIEPQPQPSGPAAVLANLFGARRPAPQPVIPKPIIVNYPTVRAYLDSKSAAKITYTYAWWKTQSARSSMWILGGILAVGVIWPIALRLLTGAGFARQKEQALLDLNQFKHEPTPPTGPPPVSDKDLERLHQVEEELERNLQHPSAAPDPAAVPATDAPARALDGQALEALPPTQEEHKHYKGEFYPVIMPDTDKE